MKSKSVPVAQGRVINKLDGVTNPERLTQLIDSIKEDGRLKDSQNQLLKDLQTILSELKENEKKLREEIINLKSSAFHKRVAAETSSLIARPGRSLKKLSLPGSRQLLAGKIFDYIYQIKSIKNLFKESLIEAKDEELSKKIQGLLNQFDEREGEADIIQLLQMVALRSDEPPIAAESSAISKELLTPLDQKELPKKVSEFYNTASDLYLAIAQWRTYLPHLARRLKKQLKELLQTLPDPHWSLTDTSPQGSGLINPGINRIIFYAQVWPKEILSSDALNRLNALLFREIGLLQNLTLVGRGHRILSDKRANEVKINSFLGDSVRILRQISGFPPEALEIIAHLASNSGPGAEWTIREAQRVDLCAAYDLLTTNWPWRQAIAPGRAFNQLWQFADVYGPELLNKFCSGIGVYPSGIIAKLTNKQSCFVEQQTDNPELPRVITIERNSGSIEPGERVDLRDSKLSIGEVPAHRIASWPERSSILRETLS